MGRQCIVVIENFSELKLLMDVSKNQNIRPPIGLRLKLSSESRGKWASSSGERKLALIPRSKSLQILS